MKTRTVKFYFYIQKLFDSLLLIFVLGFQNQEPGSVITNLSVFSQSISKVTSYKKNETFVTRKNRMLCTRHRKSLRLIGTLALSRVVVKVGAVGRRLALLAVDKVVRGRCVAVFPRVTLILSKE